MHVFNARASRTIPARVSGGNAGEVKNECLRLHSYLTYRIRPDAKAHPHRTCRVGRILLEKFSCLVDVALSLLTTNPSSRRQDA